MKDLSLHKIPSARVRSARVGWLLVALAAFNSSSAGGPKPQNELEQIFYDMGVIGYCGLSSEAASRGFRKQLEEIVERENIDPLQIRDTRNRALTMVEWEWDNRGLGGFRGWCSSEGKAAVARFSN